MSMITDSFFLDLLLVVVPVLYFFYWWYNKDSDYWDKRGIPCRKTGMLIKRVLGRQSQFEQASEMYNYFGKEPLRGLFQFNRPALLIRDPELINKVLVKDFVHFQDRGQPKLKTDPLAESLFSLRGQTWRALRYKLTPTFSTGKLKGMFEQLSKCGDNMIEKIEELSKESTAVESKLFLYEFTIDVISSCAFGLQFKPNTPEFDTFKLYVQKAFKLNPFFVIKVMVLFLSPKLSDKLGFTLFGKEAGEYFFNLTRRTAKFRKENNVQRNDYFQLLLTLKEQEESGKDMGLNAMDTGEDDAVINQMQYAGQNEQHVTQNKKLMSDEVICANSFIFLLAGSESVSSTISMTLFELSRNPDIQKKLQEEVDSVMAKNGGNWSYSNLRDMTYMDQVIQEAQRLYPVLPSLTRECVQTYKVPDSDLTIEKGLFIIIPAYGLHMDPQYYPEPEKFKPERFEGNNFKPSSTYMPFGDGPRICIAMRFAVMEVKTALARIMYQYTVKLSPKTQMPIKFEPRSIFPNPKGGIWLSFEKRKTVVNM